MGVKTDFPQQTVTDSDDESAWQTLRDIANALNSEQTETPRTSYEEMRSSKRIPCAIPVRLFWYHIHATGGATLGGTAEAMARNISRGGVGLITRRVFHQENRVIAEIFNANATWKLQCRVAFCRHLEGVFHEVGLQFLSLTPDDQSNDVKSPIT